MNPEAEQGILLPSCALQEIVPPEKIYSRLIEKFTVLTTDKEASAEDLKEGFIALTNETNDFIKEALSKNNYENSSFLFDFITQVEQQQVQLQRFENQSAQEVFLSSYRKLSRDFYNLRSNKKLSNEGILKELSFLEDRLEALYKASKTKALQSAALFSDLLKDVWSADACIEREKCKPKTPSIIVIDPATIDLEIKECQPKLLFIECSPKRLVIDPATLDLEIEECQPKPLFIQCSPKCLVIDPATIDMEDVD